MEKRNPDPITDLEELAILEGTMGADPDLIYKHGLERTKHFGGRAPMPTLSDRIRHYSESYPDFPPLTLVRGERIEGLWIMGQQYRTSGYYGAYPCGYLDRVLSMFPDVEDTDILHVPSGSIGPGDHLRVDIRPECQPDIVGDCHDLLPLVGARRFRLALVDPPYSQEDCDHYGTCMVDRRRLLESVRQVLRPGGWCVWLDQVFPMFSKRVWSLRLAIGMIKSTNHRVRAVFGFQRVEGADAAD